MSTIELSDGSVFSLAKVEGIIRSQDKPYYLVHFHHGSLKLTDGQEEGGKSYPFEELKMRWQEYMDMMSGGYDQYRQMSGGMKSQNNQMSGRSQSPGYSRSRSPGGQQGNQGDGRQGGRGGQDQGRSQQYGSSYRDRQYTSPSERRSRSDGYSPEWQEDERWSNEE